MTTDTFNTASDLTATLQLLANTLALFPVTPPATVGAADISTLTDSVARLISESAGGAAVTDGIATACMDFYTALHTALTDLQTDTNTAFAAL